MCGGGGGGAEISRNLSKQPFSTGSGRITLKNSLRDYFHLLKSPDFRLLVLKCAGSYSRVFNVFRSMRLDCQNKYFPYGPKSQLIRALLYTYTNKIVSDEILLS